MGVLDNLKDKLGFGAGWDDEYLNEELTDGNEALEPEEESVHMVPGFGDGRQQTAAFAAISTDNGEAGDKRYSYESPYASGAARSAVTKHARRPDLKRASQVSGSALRSVPDKAPVLQAQSDDGMHHARPKDFSQTPKHPSPC